MIFAQEFSQTEINEILAAHNAARSAKCLKSLSWDPIAAMVAKNYAATCPSGHNKNRDDEYTNAGGLCIASEWPYCGTSIIGENIAWMTKGTLTEFVNLWNEEEKDWSCGTLPSYQPGTGHYSQVVWSTTTKVGCGRHTNCDGLEILVCNYYPPGNFNPNTILAFPKQYCSESCSNPTTSNSISTTTQKTDIPTSTKTKIPTSTTTKTTIPTSSTSTKSTTSSYETESNSNINTSWNILNGDKSEWLFDDSVITHHGDSTGMIIFNEPITQYDDYFIVTKILKLDSEEKNFGIITGYHIGDKGQQYLEWRRKDSNYEYCFVYNNQEKCTTYSEIPTLANENPHNIKLRYTLLSNQHRYTLYINKYQFISIVLPEDWLGGNIGIQSSGNITFNYFYVSKPTSVKVTFDCNQSDGQIQLTIANTIGISTDNVIGIVRFGCSKKKDILSKEEVSVVLVGTENQSSEELASLLKSLMSSDYNVEILSISSNDISSSPSQIASIPEGYNANISIVIIVVIIVGSLLLIAGVIILVVFLVKRNEKKKNTKIKLDKLPKTKNNVEIPSTYPVPIEDDRNDNIPINYSNTIPSITPENKKNPSSMIPPPPPPCGFSVEPPNLPDISNIPPPHHSFGDFSNEKPDIRISKIPPPNFY
jgi:pathogenesis-related protein 1